MRHCPFLILTLFTFGCARDSLDGGIDLALPPNSVDAAVDGALPDMADDALCDSTWASACCVDVDRATCVAPAGTNGCPSDKCRGYYAVDGGADMALPCIKGSPSDCAYAYGTEGCPSGYCRGEPMPDLL